MSTKAYGADQIYISNNKSMNNIYKNAYNFQACIL